MTTARTTRDDVVAAAGRLFAERGYHGTSMRDLGRELGLYGSSLYAHVDSKEDLLVAVVAQGAELFQNSADAAVASSEQPMERLRALIAGHVDVVLDHPAEVRTYLNEARALDTDLRRRIIERRDRYESVFRATITDGIRNGDLAATLDVPLATIFVLSILNAVERWYDPKGRLDRTRLVEAIAEHVMRALSHHV